jgi:class 3 adenylate cyclase/DNA-binding response OmpR family regulator
MSEDVLKVVMAEDSPVQGVVLKRILTEQNFQVWWGKNGQVAYELVLEHKPDILITDAEMPVMDGFKLCQTIKNNEDTQLLPVLLCTSLSSPEDVMRGMEVGADGYVTKPYDKTFLINRIQTIMKNKVTSKIGCDRVEIEYYGKKFQIPNDSFHIMNMLLSTYENIVKQNNQLVDAQVEIKKQNQLLENSYKESEGILANVLPKKVAQELKEKGLSEPLYYNSCSVIFTDLKGFTKVAETMTPKKLVNLLDLSFGYFDMVMDVYGLEKLKTIGDSYMCAGGIPDQNFTHPVDSVLAGLEMQDFMDLMKEGRANKSLATWECRLGIHSGPVVAGVIGTKKFAYDMWGDTVNTASRMESSGEVGKVNISSSTYELVKDFFDCEYRGKITAKNKGYIDMYFVLGIKPELSKKGDGRTPNQEFWNKYNILKVAGSVHG